MYVKNLYLAMSLMTVSDDPLDNFVWREILNVHVQIPREPFLVYVQHINENGVRL
jgi:hypothetical protein